MGQDEKDTPGEEAWRPQIPCGKWEDKLFWKLKSGFVYPNKNKDLQRLGQYMLIPRMFSVLNF